MSLKEQIMADVKSAMKNKEADKVSTLRMLHSSIKNREIELRPNEITDEEVLSVLKKLVKQRKDSIEQFEKAGRNDLVEKEKNELKFIEVYLPEQLSKEQVETIINDVITSTNASSMKDMGAVMKAVQAKTQGAADNKMISEIVRARLQ